ncbi:MAG: type 4a pilus biogenesis protein PilO [Deltaproteobacteria bacterium]|nr:type 4a pilus biogenesis protein PilO [Deltaproteobacteria bacterium]
MKTSVMDSLAPFFEKVEQLSKLQRILICVGALLLLIGGFVYFSYLPKIKQIDSLKTSHRSLEQQLATAKRKAAQLNEYREKMKKAQEDFLIAKKVLPEKKEIPSLLASVSQSGQDAGLEFVLFQPKSEIVKDFYAEIPVAIKVAGTYHNVATFFDNVSRLFRLVNIQDIQMKGGQKSAVLDTSCTAVTYKFVESVEKEPTAKKSNRRTRRR